VYHAVQATGFGAAMVISWCGITELIINDPKQSRERNICTYMYKIFNWQVFDLQVTSIEKWFHFMSVVVNKNCMCRIETLLIYLATDDTENRRSVAVQKWVSTVMSRSLWTVWSAPWWYFVAPTTYLLNANPACDCITRGWNREPQMLSAVLTLACIYNWVSCMNLVSLILRV
jgi:hypothetical protein